MSEVYWHPNMKLQELEKKAILKALRFFNDNKTHTASSLGISVRNLQYKLNEYKLQEEEANEKAKRLDEHQKVQR